LTRKYISVYIFRDFLIVLGNAFSWSCILDCCWTRTERGFRHLRERSCTSRNWHGL